MKYFLNNYSQYLQDIFVKIYSDKKQGFFVEVGAFDPYTHSNTALLEEEGWNGILIEPNPSQFDRLKKRKAKLIKSAISEKKGKLPLLVAGPISSAITTLTKEHHDRIVKEFPDNVEIGHVYPILSFVYYSMFNRLLISHLFNDILYSSKGVVSRKASHPDIGLFV